LKGWRSGTSRERGGKPLDWAASCLFGSFVFWAWIILPALYYTNTWQTAHFPIMTNKAFTTGGTTYDFSKIVDDRWRLDETKYLAYGPLMLPAAFILNSALALVSPHEDIVPVRLAVAILDRLPHISPPI
jgi:hypothetical protein